MREFFTRRPLDNAPIVVKEGVEGFFPMQDKTVSDATLKALNEAHGNTEKDVLHAVSCSMFGWDIPAADLIS